MAKFQIRSAGEFKEFDSNLTHHQAVLTCKALLLSDQYSRNEFLSDIVDACTRYGEGASPARLGWLHWYANRNDVRPKPDAPTADYRIDAGRVSELFIRAQGVGLGKNGGVRLNCPQLFVKIGDKEVKLKLAPKGGKNPGCIYITIGEEYIGKIEPAGSIRPVREMPDGLIEGLKEFAADPAGYAARFGRVTGRCCFCGLELSNRHSIYNGYGETCADNWGIPYTKAPADFQPAVEARERAFGKDGEAE